MKTVLIKQRSKYTNPEGSIVAVSGLWFTVYPKTKDAFPKINLELTTGILVCINHVFVNIREF